MQDPTFPTPPQKKQSKEPVVFLFLAAERNKQTQLGPGSLAEARYTAGYGMGSLKCWKLSDRTVVMVQYLYSCQKMFEKC